MAGVGGVGGCGRGSGYNSQPVKPVPPAQKVGDKSMDPPEKNTPKGAVPEGGKNLPPEPGWEYLAVVVFFVAFVLMLKGC